MSAWLSILITSVFFISVCFSLGIVPTIFGLRALKAETGRARTRWLIGIIVLWPFISWLYGVKKGSLRDRWVIAISVAATLVSVVSVIFLVKLAVQTAADQLGLVREQASQYLSGEEDRSRLELTVTVLRTEILTEPLWMLDKKLSIMNLTQILADMISDEKFESQEFDTWMKLVDRRRTLERDILVRYRTKEIIN